MQVRSLYLQGTSTLAPQLSDPSLISALCLLALISSLPSTTITPVVKTTISITRLMLLPRLPLGWGYILLLLFLTFTKIPPPETHTLKRCVLLNPLRPPRRRKARFLHQRRKHRVQTRILRARSNTNSSSTRPVDSVLPPFLCASMRIKCATHTRTRARHSTTLRLSSLKTPWIIFDLFFAFLPGQLLLDYRLPFARFYYPL